METAASRNRPIQRQREKVLGSADVIDLPPETSVTFWQYSYYLWCVFTSSGAIWFFSVFGFSQGIFG